MERYYQAARGNFVVKPEVTSKIDPGNLFLNTCEA